MKGNIIFGISVAAFAMLSSVSLEANASCQSICMAGYRACISAGGSTAECTAERSQCIAECGGGVAVEPLKTNIRDQQGQEILIGRSRPASFVAESSKT